MMAESPLPPPRYSIMQAINVAIAVGMRALDEVRALAAVKAPPPVVDLADIERLIADAVAKLPPPKPGPAGVPGKFLPPTEWTKGIHYEGALRTHAGSTWCAVKDTADEPPHRDWILVAARGEEGPPAPVGEVCGLYEQGRRYRKFDLVVENGSEWRAKHDEPGTIPGPGWELAAKVGARGKQGEKGDPGRPGLPAPAIKEWVRDGYRAIPMMSDGTAGPALDVREFFELYHNEAG